MPLLKNKIHHLSPSPKDLKDGEEVFVVPQTKECFRSYEYLFMCLLGDVVDAVCGPICVVQLLALVVTNSCCLM